MANKTIIILGHSAYTGVNAMAVCFSKDQAEKVMMRRGMTRATFRKQIAAIDGYGMLHGQRGNTECSVYLNGATPYGWQDYASLRAELDNDKIRACVMSKE